MEKKNQNPLLIKKGRGATENSTGRFESIQRETDLDNYGWFDEEDQRTVKTEFFKDTSKSILSENKSPDLPFRYSINPYRGCEHGCAYCYARPTHEYLGHSAGLDFETKIYVKEEAPRLLREKLMSPSWKPESITVSGNTDCYQPAERKFELTRKCLEVLAEFRNPTYIITKNRLVTRDLDIFQEMAKYNTIFALISVTTLDPSLGAKLEPRTSSPEARLNAIETLAKAGIPVGVNVAPTIPGLTDHEMPAILKRAKEAGAISAGYTVVRLPLSVKDIFTDWLATHRPEAQEKVLGFIKDTRDGKLYNSTFGSRMRGEGHKADNIEKMFELFARKFGLNEKDFELSTEHFQRPGTQLSFF